MENKNKITEVKKVSVIIPNWNGLKYLYSCLKHVCESDYNNFEIIVVDNGSTDGSIDFIVENYPSVKIIALNKNTGFAFACNAGIKQSGADYIFLLNNDVDVEPDCLSNLIKVLEENPRYYMACGKMYRYDKRLFFDAAGDCLTISGAPYNRGHGQQDIGQYDKEEQVFGVCAGAAVYKKTLFDKIGLFDDAFFAYMEDVDIGLRAILSGCFAVYTPLAVCYHHGSASLGALTNRHVYLTNRNKLFLIMKNFSARWMLYHIKDIWLHQMEMAKLFSFTKRGGAFFKSRVSAFCMFPKMILKRHAFFLKIKPDWQTAYGFLENNRKIRRENRFIR